MTQATYPCEIVQQKAQPTLSIRLRGTVQDLPRQLGETYGAIVSYLSEIQQEPGGHPFAAYYNLDMQDLDVEAGFPVRSPLPGRGRIEASEIKAGKAAICLYVGPYEECQPAYETLARFIADSGYEAAGMCYEFYLNDPRVTLGEPPRMRIVMPLK